MEAGDRMANALIGNLSGTTGAAITTTVTGGNTAAALAVFNPALNQTVRIQGAGLSGPVDITFNGTDSTVGGAVTDLVNKVASNNALKAAGISLSGTAGSPLVFTSARGESFSVMATGDATNQLGLGSFVTNGSASGAVDYKSITGAVSSDVSSANDQASLQFSINGAAATAVSIDLTAGDAVAASLKTSAISNPSIAAATASHTVGVTALATHDWSSANETFTVAVNPDRDGTGPAVMVTPAEESPPWPPSTEPGHFAGATTPGCAHAQQYHHQFRAHQLEARPS